MVSGRAPQHPRPRARVDKSRRPAVRWWFGSSWNAALRLRRRRVSRRSSLGRPFGTPGIAVDGYAPASRALHNRQTTAFETRNGRLISTSGTALNAPFRPSADASMVDPGRLEAGGVQSSVECLLRSGDKSIGGSTVNRVSRRAVLAGGLAASAASFDGIVPLLAANQAEQALKDVASARGIRYGSTAMAS